jgi:hypothetical protein
VGALKQGCRKNVVTCRYAARGGHLAVLQAARGLGCPWDEITAAMQLGVGTWRHGINTARGTLRLVHTPLRAGTWRRCNGPGSMAASGMFGRVPAPL